MKRELVGRATLAELLRDESFPAASEQLAALFGFQWEAAPAAAGTQGEHEDETKAEHSADDASPTDSSRTGQQPVESAGEEREQRQRQVSFWCPVGFRPRRTRTPGGETGADDVPEAAAPVRPPIGPDEPFEVYQRRPFSPLAKVADISVRLRRQPELARPTCEPDVERLIDDYCRGHLTAEIPFLTKKSWGQSLFVVEDTSDRLFPYLDDVALLSYWLRRRGSTGNTFAVFNDRNGGWRENWPIVGWPRERAGEDLLPAVGATVLAMTDLGVLSRRSEASRCWERIGRRLTDNENRLIALVPCRADAVGDELSRLWQIVAWEPQPADDPGAPGVDETGAAVDRLLALLSYSDCIEPQLLRHIRRLLPEGRRDSGLEARVWQRPELRTTNPEGAVVDASERGELIRLRDAEPPALKQQVFDEIRRMHQGDFHGLMCTEVLNLGDEAESLVPESFRRNAENWYGRAGTGETIPPSVRRFFRIAARQLTRPAMERYEVLHELWHRICGHVPGALPPDGFDAARAGLTGRPQTVAISHIGEAFSYHVTAGSARPRADNRESQVGSIRHRGGWLKIESFNDLPDESREAPFWREPAPPSWATDWGTDAQGQWAEFTLHALHVQPPASSLRSRGHPADALDFSRHVSDGVAAGRRRPLARRRSSACRDHHQRVLAVRYALHTGTVAGRHGRESESLQGRTAACGEGELGGLSGVSEETQ